MLVHIARALLFGAVMLGPFACSEDEPGGGGERTCGDGECDIGTCETRVRCAGDCGACVGSECQVGGTRFNCDAPCDSSCDCINESTFCSKDYGFDDGRCLPVACLTCSDVGSCAVSGDTMSCDMTGC